jgi:hypothetical protein
MEISNKNINFYTLPKVQKYMTKHNDEQKQYTGIPITQHCLCVGKTGSGKSNTLMNYIYATGLPKNGTFKKIYLCVKKIEPFTKFLMSELKDLCVVFTDLDKFPAVDDFKDLSDKNDDHYLVVFDDCINDKSKKDITKINNYFTYGRSKGVHCFFLSQSFFQTEIFIRKQVSFVLLCGITGKRDLLTILSDYQIGELNKATLENMYHHCKEKEDKDDMNFMKICTYESPLNEKFSKNFLNYLNPTDYYVPDKPCKKKFSQDDEEN